MRRRALLSAILLGGLAMLSRASAVQPLLDTPLDPEEGEEEEPPPSEPPPTEPPLAPEEEEEEEAPPTEPA